LEIALFLFVYILFNKRQTSISFANLDSNENSISPSAGNFYDTNAWFCIDPTRLSLKATLFSINTTFCGTQFFKNCMNILILLLSMVS